MGIPHVLHEEALQSIAQGQGFWGRELCNLINGIIISFNMALGEQFS